MINADRMHAQIWHDFKIVRALDMHYYFLCYPGCLCVHGLLQMGSDIYLCYKKSTAKRHFLAYKAGEKPFIVMFLAKLKKFQKIQNKTGCS